MPGSVERIEVDLIGHDRSMGRTLDETSRKADKAGRSLDGLGKDARALDRHIGTTEEHLKGLIAEFEKTGDKTLFRDIRKDRSTLSLLQSMRKEVEKIQTAGSGAFSGGGSLPPVLIGALVPVLAAATPAIGAAVGGAVIGAVGAGGIVGGVIAGMQDPRVGAALSHFTDSFMADFASAGTPFIQPLVRAFGELEQTSGFFVSTLHNGFSELAPLVGPLVKGIDGLVNGLGRGLDKVFSGPAQKAIRALANELPEIGNAIDDALTAMSDGSDGATMGLIELLHVVEDFISSGGEFIGWLSKAFEWFVNVGYAVTTVELNLAHMFRWVERIPVIGDAFGFVRGQLQDLNDEDVSLLEGLKRSKDATGDWDTSLRDLRDTTEEQAAALANFNDEIEKYLGKTLGVEEAQIRLKKQWVDTTETLKDGKKTLDINTQAGRDNETALIDLIKAADAVRVAEYNKTGSLEAANAAYDRQLTRLRDMAVKLGFDKTKVDELIDSVKTGNAIGGLQVPVTMPGLDRYIQRLNYFIQQLGIAKGLAAAEFATYREGERNPSGKASGGSVRAGQSYIVGENGPELVTMGANGYVHTASQTRSMLSGASGGWAGPARVVIDVTGADEEMKRFIRKIVRVDGGGNVQSALGQN